MSDPDAPSQEEPTVTAPIVDLLKRHGSLPSRSLILSEAFEMTRRLSKGGARATSEESAQTTET